MRGKRTFIKVRRGILDGKHRLKLGEAWYLYLFILDSVNWETGTIYEWRDADIAEMLGVYLPTLRNHRKRLEDQGYIVVIQKQHCLEITVNKWENPASKHVEDDNEGYNVAQSSTPQGHNQGDNQGNNEGHNQGDNTLSLTTFNSDNQTYQTITHTDRTAQISETQRLLESLTGIPPANAADVDAIREIEMMNPTEQDIRAAIAWVQTRGVKRIKRYTSLVNPISVCMSNRVNKPKTTLDKSKDAVMQVLEEVGNGIN